MKYKILFAGDLHKRMKSITTIKGYTQVNIELQLSLMQILKKLRCTHFFSLGDWFDKGYGSDTAAALAHTDIDREMSSIIDDNFFGVIGNHIRINLDSNPELFLIQPHPIYTTRHRIVREEQIIKTPNDIVLNNVQISLMHHNKFAESAADYKPIRREGISYHIALYHTPYIVPTWHLHRMGMNHIANENSKIAMALEGVDLAIVGDIHKPIGTFKINKADGTTTTMIIPGSLTNTDAGLGSRHNFIDMPLIEIDEYSKVTINYERIDLLTNRLSFQQKTNSSDNPEKLKSIRGNNKENLYEDNKESSVVSSSQHMSLNSFMIGQRYTETDRFLIQSVLEEPENIDRLINIYREGEVYEHK